MLGSRASQRPSRALQNTEGGGRKAESTAQAPRCRNEHPLLDQVVRSVAESNSLRYLGKKAFVWSLSVDCYLFQRKLSRFKRNKLIKKINVIDRGGGKKISFSRQVAVMLN